MAVIQEQLYRYSVPSRVDTSGREAELTLSTSGGTGEARQSRHPVLFDGFVERSDLASSALLVIARIARSRFYVPPRMLARVLRAADPVVTCAPGRLRFESFSACCGVYARFDIHADALDAAVTHVGSTNVDFNPPMREALARVRVGEPLHLRVGEDVTVRTLDHEVTEIRVPLPDRWVKGFAEVQVAAMTVSPAMRLSPVDMRNLLRMMPRSDGRALVWVRQTTNGPTVTSRASEDAVSISRSERLRVLEPLLPFSTGVRVFAAPFDPAGRTSVWELDLIGSRLTLALSPDASRGFSGEGGVLRDLLGDDVEGAADRVADVLSPTIGLTLQQIADGTDLDDGGARHALVRLAAEGRVGYDVTEQAYFYRELPFDAERLTVLHPRLRDATGLIAADAVRMLDDRAVVSNAGADYIVRFTDRGETCSCPWYAKYGSSRGPCKHALAAWDVRRREL